MANTAAINRSGFPELLGKAIEVKFDETLQGRQQKDDNTLSKLFMILDSKSAAETRVAMGGFGLFREVDEGDRIPIVVPDRGRAAKWIHKQFAQAFAITEQMVEDSATSTMSAFTEGLINAGMDSRMYYALLVLALGFGDAKTATAAWNTDDFSLTGTKYVGADGKPLFATDHPISGTPGSVVGHPLGSTYSNKLAAAMTETSIGTAIGMLDSTPNSRGQIAKKRAASVWYPSGLRLRANQILKSGSTMTSGLNSGVRNLVADEGLEGVELPWLPDSNDWGVAAAPKDTTLTIYDRVKFRDYGARQEDEFITGNRLVKARARWSAGYSDPRGIVGSIVPTGQ